MSHGSVSRTRFIAGAAALFAAVPAMAAADGARSGPWCRPLSEAAKTHVFDFQLDLLDPAPGSDGVFTLSTLQGRPVWLNFFASWCPPCNQEAGDIVSISRRYDDRLHVVGVDVGEKEPAARSFRDLHKISYPIVLDRKKEVFGFFKFYGYPTHMFLDAEGYISCISVGDLTIDQMDNEIAVAIARKPLARIQPSEASPAPR